jgi:hypothetical protein
VRLWECGSGLTGSALAVVVDFKVTCFLGETEQVKEVVVGVGRIEQLCDGSIYIA